MAILDPGTPDDIQSPSNSLNALLVRLAELGYVDGQNVTFEFRFANHALERLPALATELVATQPDVLWTYHIGRRASGCCRPPRRSRSSLLPLAEETMAALIARLRSPAREHHRPHPDQS